CPHYPWKVQPDQLCRRAAQLCDRHDRRELVEQEDLSSRLQSLSVRQEQNPHRRRLDYSRQRHSWTIDQVSDHSSCPRYTCLSRTGRQFCARWSTAASPAEES